VTGATAYAGIVTRLSALTVDALALAAVVPLVGTGVPALWSAATGDTPGWLRAGAQLVAAFVPPVYFALCWWGTGQTLGGLLFGTAVRRPDGARLSALRAVARAFAGLAAAPVWLAGMAVTLWDPRRRALHDRLLGTVVQRRL